MSPDPGRYPHRSAELIGRAEQRSMIAAALAGVQDAGRALVIVGGPGMGKTALLDAAHETARAAGFTVLRCTGSRHDRLHRLWHLHEAVYPLLESLPRLPARQRAALCTAFDALDGPEPDLPSVRLAVLGLLELAAAHRPVVLLVDDWHWLDASSADVLSFVAGEVSPSPVVLLATSRTLDDLPPTGAAPALLPPMSDRESAELLDSLAVDPSGAERILGFAGGNPLALVEYAGAPAREPGDATVPPPTDRLANSFLDEVQALSATARLLLLCAAAGARATTSELLRAGQLVGAGPADVQELTRLGLLDLGGELPVVRRPLLGAIVYADAAMTERITVHRALARVSGDPLQAARHLAVATPHQDARVAAALERTAHGAAGRGALAEAVTVLTWSADLSPSLDVRAGRLGDAAELARQAGLAPATDRLLHEAYAAGESPDVAALAITRAGDRSSRGAGSGDVPLLLSLSRRLARRDGEPRVAERLRVLAAAATLSATDTPAAPVLDAATAEIMALELADRHPVRVAALAVLDPGRHGAGLIDRWDELICDAGDDPARLMLLGRAAQAVQDVGRAVAVHERSAHLLGIGGRSADQARELLCLALLRVLSGDLRQAYAQAGQAGRLAAALGLDAVEAEACAVLAVAQAWIGDGAESGTAMERSRRLASWSATRARRGWASALTALVQGRYRAAWVDLQAVAAHPVTAAWAVADCAEAAVLSGRAELVVDLVGAAEDQARSWRSDHLTALTDRARALIDPSTGAPGAFESSIAAADRAGSVLESGRSHLAYGRWLRRRRRIVPAREHLSTAVAVFHTAGARPWARLAQRELEAAGVGSAAPSTRFAHHDRLTPQERQIAELAAGGLSNREIAAQLLLSHRTIGTHLYRAFTKLAVTDRRQVGQALIGAR